MAAKLSDAEFAARTRASAARRSERQRLRKSAAGKVQVNCWLSAESKARLDQLAAEGGTSLSETIEAAIHALDHVVLRASTCSDCHRTVIADEDIAAPSL